MKLNWYNYLEFATMLFCFANYFVKRAKVSLIFALFLLLVCSNNIAIKYVWGVLHKPAHIIFNGNLIIVYLFYNIFLNKQFFSLKLKRISNRLITFTCLFWLVWCVGLGKINQFIPFLTSVMAIPTLLTCVLFLLDSINKPLEIDTPNEISKLIICFGILIFFSTVGICFIFYDYILKYDIKFMGELIYKTIPRLMCVLLYSSIIAGLILWKKK